MNDILRDLPGVLCHIDDILVFGLTGDEHDSSFLAVLERIKAAGITLNPDKCQFSQPSHSWDMSSIVRIFHQTQGRQQPS